MKNASLLHLLSAFLFVAVLSSCQNAETAADTAAATADAATETIAVAAKTADPTASTEYQQGVQVGDKAPTFKLKNIDDKLYSFENIKDANGKAPKGFIVTFTCNTCPYAVGYEDRLIALHQKMSVLGYPVVAIQPNDPEVKDGDSFAQMKVRAQEKGFPFVYLLDAGQQIYPQYGASRTPEVYLVDSDLMVRYHGAIDDNAQDAEAVTVNYVEKAVTALQNGLNPDPADVKAIGCTIKTKKT
ncbi:MAG: thioredoxin family protein [Bacteroidetes bacterium]|nr:MAG: thioredoxin family protein [Bacteroidota bacterium]PTM12264.1 MAG: thioredoxin family protein [Bacteroidota bacterium]